MKHRLLFHKKSRDQVTKYWKNMSEMHEVMHSFTGYIKAVLLELLKGPMSRDEILHYLNRFPLFEMKTSDTRRGKKWQSKFQNTFHRQIERALESKILEEKGAKLFLTPAGREMAEHMQEVIPKFIGFVFSPKTVSIITITVHVILTIIKCIIGLLSHSAGLLSDGIDNGVDTLSSVFVWMGIKYKKERLVSYLIVGMMFFSLLGISMACYNKIVHPRPVKDGIAALVVSALCGFGMLFLSIYQYVTGRRNGCFPLKDLFGKRF